MKTLAAAPPARAATAAIVSLSDVGTADDGARAAATAASGDGFDGEATIERARAFVEPLLAGRVLDTGEPAFVHAEGVAAILRAIGASPGMQAAGYLVYAGDWLQRPEEVVARAFGPSHANLVTLTRRLVQIQRTARHAQDEREAAPAEAQTERVRKMLLAFSRDLRVVLLRLASRLQTMRWHAAEKQACPPSLARETLAVFAPLANRLGIWQIKWELEDLSFRFLDPEAYRRVALLLDERRIAREESVERARTDVATLLARAGIDAEVVGRPKHLYSIWKKMQGKRLGIERVYDVRALRVIVADTAACYAALARVHEAYAPVDGEFDDYIARPKPNGYQSLHTVVREADGRALEVQVRTRAMHEHAEHGVAAHWLYKEAGARGYAGVSASGDYEQRLADARKSVLRELLAWEREFASQAPGAAGDARSATAPGGAAAALDERIYVFTPQATVIELTRGATPIDFAYALHTDLGHRCRGARVDGVMVPLQTSLEQGQTVEIVAAKEGGPSLDWLNPELGYLRGTRSRAKVRAWFNALAQGSTIARGREAVEKLLQREGRTALKLDHLAEQLGFKSADALFEVVGKDEYSLRHIEQLLRPAPAAAPEEAPPLRRARSRAGDGGVLVVGLGSMMTALARCCRPAPPDAIGGFVTRGKGVAVHRADCSNFRHMADSFADRVIDVAWAAGGSTAPAAAPGSAAAKAAYPVDLVIEADDRQGLLRDLADALAKQRLDIVAVQSQSQRTPHGMRARFVCTVEVASAEQLGPALAAVRRVDSVRVARRAGA